MSKKTLTTFGAEVAKLGRYAYGCQAILTSGAKAESLTDFVKTIPPVLNELSQGIDVPDDIFTEYTKHPHLFNKDNAKWLQDMAIKAAFAKNALGRFAWEVSHCISMPLDRFMADPAHHAKTMRAAYNRFASRLASLGGLCSITSSRLTCLVNNLYPPKPRPLTTVVNYHYNKRKDHTNNV